jgi:hypothetical protein
MRSELLDQIEIIVLDNGSFDHTVNILNLPIFAKKIKVLRFLKNKRGSISYFELIKKAKGEYLIFPGDDDIFIDESLINLIETVDKVDNNVSLIAYGAKTINASGKSNIYKYSPPTQYLKAEIIAKLFSDSVFWMPATVVKKSIFDDIKEPSTLTSFDWWMWVVALCNGEMKLIDLALVKYRQHEGQEQHSYLDINWKIDSLLMIQNIVNEVVHEWLKQQNSDTKYRFSSQLAKEIQSVNLDDFQLIKWSILVSTIAPSINVLELLSEIPIFTTIWNDPRFIEVWYNIELPLTQILSYYETYGFTNKLLKNVQQYSLNTKTEGIFSKTQSSNAIEIFENKIDGKTLYDVNITMSGNNLQYNNLSEENLKSKLKDIFRQGLSNRKVENYNQISRFEIKLINLYRRTFSNNFKAFLKIFIEKFSSKK